MFCYVALSVCLSVPPHIQNKLLVWMLGFIAIFFCVFFFCRRDVDLCLDLCYFWGVGGLEGGSFVLKLSFWGVRVVSF